MMCPAAMASLGASDWLPSTRLCASSSAVASSIVLPVRSGTVKVFAALAIVSVTGSPSLTVVSGRRILHEDRAGVDRVVQLRERRLVRP